jgi:hypothetical protein
MKFPPAPESTRALKGKGFEFLINWMRILILFLGRSSSIRQIIGVMVAELSSS